MPPTLDDVPPLTDESTSFDLIAHRSSDLIQAIAFNAYGDRCATGSVDGQIRIFNRRKDGIWQLSDSWGAHAGEILEVCLLLSGRPHARKRPSCPTTADILLAEFITDYDHIAAMAAAHSLSQHCRLAWHRRSLQALGRR